MNFNALCRKCLYGFVLLGLLGLKAQEFVLGGNVEDIGITEWDQATDEYQASRRPVKLIRTSQTPNIVVVHYSHDVYEDCKLFSCSEERLEGYLSGMASGIYSYYVVFNFEGAFKLTDTEREEFFLDVDGHPLSHDAIFVDSVPITLETDDKDYDISRSRNRTSNMQWGGGNTFYIRVPLDTDLDSREVILDGDVVDLGNIDQSVTLIRTPETPNIVVANYSYDGTPSYIVLNFEAGSNLDSEDGEIEAFGRETFIFDARPPSGLRFRRRYLVFRDISRSGRSPNEYLIRNIRV